LSTKKLQILGSFGSSDADTLDGMHADEFVAVADEPVYALEDGEDIYSEVINIDTFGGRTPDEYALVSDLTSGLQALEDSKASAGYGYGGAAISLKSARVETDDELTTLLEDVYSAMSGATTKLVYWTGYPSATSHGWFGILSKSSQNNGSIKAWSANLTGSLIFKVKFSGAWKPLEWQNPPMEVGVEYRTTERYQGKPVYAKCISVGMLPSNAKSETPHGISNSKNFVAVWGHSGRYYFPTQWNADSIGTINIYATSTNVFVKTTETWNNYAAYVTIKYTKSTD